jgi:hypothetical protein
MDCTIAANQRNSELLHCETASENSSISSSHASESTPLKDDNKKKDRRKDTRGKKSKKHKKEKKTKKEKKRRRDSDDDGNEGAREGENIKRPTWSTTEQAQTESNVSIPNTTTGCTGDSVKPEKTSKSAFFANLLAQEMKKPATGTVHAVGKKDPILSISQAMKPGDWTCQKCSANNMKEALQCSKCRAMKRLSTYR